ncbi:MAG: excinuclease ABC subunit UvrC [Ruminococcaceae bacterium]|nr:excinuclease ABC subunit UvrC [Oscillospiraceae bacterium]
MPQSEKRKQELLEKANSLPVCPGVYIMRDKGNKVIYVGKSRKLKNRVSQYFQNSRKNFKTEKMVRATEDFDYIVCSTEIEALSLENTLIKQHSPRYNIRLKDAKSYPYIKITAEEYPRLVYTRTRLSDKARYFGPFTGTATVFTLLDVIKKSLGIPNCKRRFPQDIGKERPCLYYQMNQCCGVCTGKVSAEEYNALIKCAADILKGNISSSVRILEEQMMDFADKENFEAAARCRDTINALKRLNEKQQMVSAPGTDQDVFGIYTDDLCACISVMYVRDGAVTDKSDHVFGAETLVDSTSLSSFIIDHYRVYDYIPKTILISFSLEEEDSQMISEYLSQKAGYKVSLRTPERGDLHKLCATVDDNAAEKARQFLAATRKDESVLVELAELLQLEVLPERIEAYDVSNFGSDNKVCGMIVCSNGKFDRADYRSFNIKSVEGTDDYACMREALSRRFEHLESDAAGSFSKLPDLILLDGGKGHVSVIKEMMRERGIMDIPVFGMVKDDFHKTRALSTDTEEINIAKHRSVFMLIYRIQDEVHRFSVSKTTKAKSSTLKRSSLEKISGIGKAKAAILLRELGGLAAVKRASVEELSAIKGISKSDATNIFEYFHAEK